MAQKKDEARYIVRASAKGDEDALLALAKKTGAGLTTLPADRDALAEKIDASCAAFAGPATAKEKRIYLLVLEDRTDGRLLGTSAVISGIGHDRPFYTYRLLHLTHASNDPEIRIDTQLLQLSNDFTGMSELATLFLDPDYRGGPLGRLVSKARYLLLASHKKRFAEKIISEIRGYVDAADNSPFWEAIGRHFFQMDFKTADAINGRGNSQFITDLMPDFPIYTALLPETARAVIGRPHDKAVPAARLLEAEGFRFSGTVDIFDGGPTYEADLHGLKTVRSSRSLAYKGVLCQDIKTAGDTEDLYLIANPKLDAFKVGLGSLLRKDQGAFLTQSLAQALALNIEDQLRFVKF